MANEKTNEFEKVYKVERKKVDDAIANAKKALANKNIDLYDESLTAAVEACKSLNVVVRRGKYLEFLESDNPIKTAIRTFYVTSYGVKEVHDKDTGRTTDVILTTNDKTRIDIEDMVKWAELSRVWITDCYKLLALLQARKTDIYSLTASQLSAQSYYFINAINQKKAGKTPDSNTQVVALLQKIADETIFEDNGSGLNKFKCTHRDIAFIEDCAHQFDPKSKCAIKSIKQRTFVAVMVSVLYSMMTGEAYSVKNAKIKES